MYTYGIQQRGGKKSRRARVFLRRFVRTAAVLALCALAGWYGVRLIQKAAPDPFNACSRETISAPAAERLIVTEPFVASSLPRNDYKEVLPLQKAPILLQNPELPTGCEATAAAMLLRAYGYDVDKLAFAKALPKGAMETRDDAVYAPDPSEAFIGNPASANGYGVYASPVTKTMQALINSANGSHRAMDISGASQTQIVSYIDRGIPVCIWATVDLREPTRGTTWQIISEGVYTDETFTWQKGEHCMLLVGCDRQTVTVHDPMKGVVTYERDLFFQRYEEIGRYAIVLE